MYRDDFQNILRKQRPSLFILRSFIQPGHRSPTNDRSGKFGDIFQESIKQKIQSLQQYASNSRNKLIWKPVLQKGTSSRCVLFIRRLSKHDRCRKNPNFKKDKLTYLSTNFNFAPSPTARKPKLRHMKEC